LRISLVICTGVPLGELGVFLSIEDDDTTTSKAQREDRNVMVNACRFSVPVDSLLKQEGRQAPMSCARVRGLDLPRAEGCKLPSDFG
jgi:hypothetical protein